MAKYKDRGILKWAPFDALDGQHTVLEDMIYNVNKKDKTTLSEDQEEEIDSIIRFSYENKKEVIIKYYSCGYNNDTYGYIKNINSVKKMITLDTNEEIDLDNILSIKMVD